MEDGIGLFKILVVVLVVGYQIVKALQKKAARATVPPGKTDAEEGPTPEAEPSPWEPDPVSWEPEPAPGPQTQPDSFRERIRTLVLGRMEKPASTPLIPQDPPPPDLVPLEAPVAALSRSRGNAPVPVPGIRDLLISQVILGPAPGLRGTRPPPRNPGGLRP